MAQDSLNLSEAPFLGFISDWYSVDYPSSTHSKLYLFSSLISTSCASLPYSCEWNLSYFFSVFHVSLILVSFFLASEFSKWSDVLPLYLCLFLIIPVTLLQREFRVSKGLCLHWGSYQDSYRILSIVAQFQMVFAIGFLVIPSYCLLWNKQPYFVHLCIQHPTYIPISSFTWHKCLISKPIFNIFLPFSISFSFTYSG